MYRRLFTVLLIVMTMGFFIYHHVQKRYAPITFADTIAPATLTEESFNQDEFLLLMDQGKEARLKDVLTEFDLELVSPLGEWVLARRTSALDQERVVSLRAPQAQEEMAMVTALEQHEAVHSASLNYLLPRESMISCTPMATDDKSKWDPLESTCRHASLSIL